MTRPIDINDLRNIVSNYIPNTIKLTGYVSESNKNIVYINDKELQIEPSKSIQNKSEEFSWGYLGSGPAQLALAILMEYLPYNWALNLYQRFKEVSISKLPQTNFQVNIELRVILLTILNERHDNNTKTDSDN
mgnify:FL=1